MKQIRTEVLKLMNDFSGIASSGFDSDCVEVTVLTERRTGQSEGEPVRKKSKITALDKLLGPKREETSLTTSEELEQYLAEKVIKILLPGGRKTRKGFHNSQKWLNVC